MPLFFFLISLLLIPDATFAKFHHQDHFSVTTSNGMVRLLNTPIVAGNVKLVFADDLFFSIERHRFHQYSIQFVMGKDRKNCCEVILEVGNFIVHGALIRSQKCTSGWTTSIGHTDHNQYTVFMVNTRR